MNKETYNKSRKILEAAIWSKTEYRQKLAEEISRPLKEQQDQFTAWLFES